VSNGCFGHFESISKKLTRIAATRKYTLFLISMVSATGDEGTVLRRRFSKNIGVSGFAFRAPAATIDKWVMEDDVRAWPAHAWGLWVGVNLDRAKQFGDSRCGSSKRGIKRGASDDRRRSGGRNTALRTTTYAATCSGFRTAIELPLTAAPEFAARFVKFDPTAADAYR